MKIVIAAGGTGGHIFPALVTARKIREKYPDAEISFVGTRRGMETKIIPDEDFKINYIKARGLSSNPIKMLGALAETAIGFFQSIAILGKLKPEIILGAGGYLSAPVVMAGRILGIKSVIMEQNLLPGKTTKFLAKLAEKICTGFNDSAKYLPPGKAEYTGNPIRQEIILADKIKSRVELGLEKERFTLLVMGGSQGARSINEGILQILADWKDKNWQILHITGEKNYEELTASVRALMPEGVIKYRGLPFLKEMEKAYASADLVISRAGAITLAELTARGLPAILVPYSHAAEDHQRLNAEALERTGAAVVIADSEIRPRLKAAVEELAGNPARLQVMAEKSRKAGKPDAAEKILQIIESFIKK